MTPSSVHQYDLVSRIFHWLTALMVSVAFVLGPGGFGRLMRRGVDPASRIDIVWHESLGVAVLVLTALRILWVSSRPTPPVFLMARWMQLTQKFVHGTIWFLLLSVPLTALVALGGKLRPATLLGGIRWEQLSLIAEWPLSKMADWGDVHSFLADVLIWLAGFHALAAIYHGVVLKDGLLAAMLPRKGIR